MGFLPFTRKNRLLHSCSKWDAWIPKWKFHWDALVPFPRLFLKRQDKGKQSKMSGTSKN